MWEGGVSPESLSWREREGRSGPHEGLVLTGGVCGGGAKGTMGGGGSRKTKQT